MDQIPYNNQQESTENVTANTPQEGNSFSVLYPDVMLRNRERVQNCDIQHKTEINDLSGSLTGYPDVILKKNVEENSIIETAGMVDSNTNSVQSLNEVISFIKKNNIKDLEKQYSKNPDLFGLPHYEGNTLLHLAASLGKTKSLRWLLKREMSSITKTNDRGETCVHLASKNGHLKILQAIVFSGLSPPLDVLRSRDEGGDTVLHIAVTYGHTIVVKWITKQQGKITAEMVNNKGQTPLHIAAAEGQEKLVAHLVKVRKDEVGRSDQNGLTPLVTAIQYNHLKCVKVLSKFCDIFENNYANGLAPIHVAATEGQLDILKFFTEKYGTKCLHFQTQEGANVFHLVAETGNAAVLKFLLKIKGGKKSARQADYHGITPLEKATNFGHAQCAELLAKIKKVKELPNGSKTTHAAFTVPQSQAENSRKQAGPSRDSTSKLCNQRNRPAPLSLPGQASTTVLVEQTLDESINAEHLNWEVHSPLAVIQKYNGFLHGSRESAELDNDDLPTELDFLDNNVKTENSAVSNFPQDLKSDVVSTHPKKELENDLITGSNDRTVVKKQQVRFASNTGFHTDPELEGKTDGENAVLIDENITVLKETDFTDEMEYISNSNGKTKILVTNEATTNETLNNNNKTENKSDKKDCGLSVAPLINASTASSPGQARRNFHLNYGAYTKAVLTRRETKSHAAIVYTDDPMGSDTRQSEGNMENIK